MYLIVVENTTTKAQDSHFTQYNASPQNLNPAQTGLFDGDWRLAGNYRTQWAAIANVPFNTYSISGDRRLSPKNNGKPKKSVGAVGLVVNSDKSGDSKLKATQVALSLARIKQLTADSTHFISVGIQPGITNKNFNTGAITFDEQFDGNKYNSALGTGENFASNSINYFDIGAGAAYYWKKTARKTLNLGFSAFHLNKPKQSFYKDKNVKLDVKYNLSAIAEIPLGAKFGILPSFILQRQGKQKQNLLGLFGKYYLTPIGTTTTAIALGFFVRAKDAFALVANMDYQNFNVGVSYDINYSNLNLATNNRGAFELSVIYIFKKVAPFIAEKRPCPIFM